jgi:hypothetical protein
MRQERTECARWTWLWDLVHGPTSSTAPTGADKSSHGHAEHFAPRSHKCHEQIKKSNNVKLSLQRHMDRIRQVARGGEGMKGRPAAAKRMYLYVCSRGWIMANHLSK